ncbi:MAG TPA: OmpA family protein [Allosphingosinicella sp.]|nr:OmpA family protein [Allosphingosinicella sp.]
MQRFLLISAAVAAALSAPALARPGGEREPGWSRSEMRAYGFRQTPQGARMTMNQDVLFATASDELYARARERLRALARYLRANPGVRVAIDGHADARGSDAYNQDLSERRAGSVRDALDELGAGRTRFRVAGHGERSPVASNATAEGMRRNRRVEITLLGRRADEF